MATDPQMIDEWYQDYMTSPPQAAAQAAAAPVNTATWTPDQQSTVAHQVNMLTAQGSPLIDQAQTAAKKQANASGLLNSTMAATAGQDAAYRVALPIALQDAAMFADAGKFNAGAQNQAMLTGAALNTDVSKFNAGATNDLQGQQNAAGVSSAQQQTQIAAQLDQQVRDIEAQKQMQTAGFTQQTQMQTAQFDQQMKVMQAQTEEQLKLIDVQNGTQLAESYRAASQSTYDAYITEVQAIQQSDMDPDVKAAQIEQMQGLYQTRQEYINVIYAAQPGWSEDWSTFAVEFGEPAPGV